MTENSKTYILAGAEEAEKLGDTADPDLVYLEKDSGEYKSFETVNGDDWIRYDSIQDPDHSRGTDIAASPNLSDRAVESLEHFCKLHNTTLEILEM